MWNLDDQEPALIKNQLKSLQTYGFFVGLLLWGYTVFGGTLSFLVVSIFAFIIVLHSLIDFKTFILPDRITFPGIFLGIVLPPLTLGHGWIETIVGFLLGYGFFWCISVGYEKFRGQPGLGFGDVKLLGMLGAWCGALQLPLILLMASLSGLVMIILRGFFTDKKGNQPMPFGPFLCAGGWLVLLYPVQIWDAILSGRMALIEWLTKVLL